MTAHGVFSSADATRPTYGESTNGTPRWVKVFGLIAVVLLVLLLVVSLLTGGHGPGRHALFSHAGGDTPQSSVTKRCVQRQ